MAVQISKKMMGSNPNYPSPLLLAEHEVLEVVIFKLDDQQYGLWLENVGEILRMVAITSVPEEGDTVEGIINLRGKIVPLLDMRKCLGFPAKPYTLSTHIIIAWADGRTIGLLVDCVTKVTDIFRGMVMPAQEIAPQGSRQFCLCSC